MVCEVSTPSTLSLARSCDRAVGMQAGIHDPNVGCSMLQVTSAPKPCIDMAADPFGYHVLTMSLRVVCGMYLCKQVLIVQVCLLLVLWAPRVRISLSLRILLERNRKARWLAESAGNPSAKMQ